MHDPRINTFAAIAIILLFGVGAVAAIQRAIMQIDWSYTTTAERTLIEF